MPPRRIAAECLDPEAAGRNALLQVNELRARHGLGPLRFDPVLAIAATRHSHDQQNAGILSHMGTDGMDFRYRARKAGFNGSPRGENVAWNQPTAKRAIDAWARQHGHFRNMTLSRATVGAVGYACDPARGHWWTLMIG